MFAQDNEDMFRNNVIRRNQELEPLEDPGQVTGFSSPAQDYIQDRLHIIQKLVDDPTNTYYFEMKTDELLACGIAKGALLIVDRSVNAKSGSTVVVNLEGEWMVRKLLIMGKENYLTNGEVDENSILLDDDGMMIFGVVTWSCNPLSVLVKHY